MWLKRLLCLLFTTLVCGVGIGMIAAQDFSLGDLAAENDLYIGAAVYTTHLNDPVHVETLSREFNMLTPEQEAKHCELERQQGQYDFRDFDQLVAFAEEHDMAIHGHTLVWHSCMPGWISSGDFSREEAIQLLHDHIMTTVGRYKGRIAIWDVVNEGIADSGAGLRETPWQQLIGDDYIELAFQFAHEADPDALLFYNDYGAEGSGGKSDAVYEMVSDFVARGIPIHGVGLQAHFGLGTGNVGAIAANMERLGELGLQVQITEIDVRYQGETTPDILQRQADTYRAVLEACMDADNCTAFITWGVTDKFTWLRSPNLGFFENTTVQPLLFDDNYAPKPAYFALLDLLASRAGVTLTADAQVAAQSEEQPAEVVEIPPPTRSDPAQLAPDSALGLVYYAPFPVSITLDGDADDWANVPRVTIDSGPMLPPNADTAMTFAAAADDTHLYFFAEVQDSRVIYGNYEPGEWYREDSVEFYINATGDLSASSYQPGVAQIGILAANLTNPDTPLIGGGNSADSQVDAVVIETEDGYRVEASVPLETAIWSITPEHLGVLGFQAHLNGSSADDRDTKLIWSAADTQDNSWQDPSLFGQLIFWDKAQ
jgi:GH35 family endo-1,4-beta-xylanase